MIESPQPFGFAPRIKIENNSEIVINKKKKLSESYTQGLICTLKNYMLRYGYTHLVSTRTNDPKAKLMCSLFQAFRSWEGATKCEKKQNKNEGMGYGVRARFPPLSLSPSSSLFFSRSLTSRRAPPSERL